MSIQSWKGGGKEVQREKRGISIRDRYFQPFTTNRTELSEIPERKQGGEMKIAKVTLFTLLAALVAVGVSTTAYAFHSAGVAPLQRTPGGDFGWLKKSYTFVIRGTSYTDDGATFGHDITAVDFGYSGRSNNPEGAPGGTYPT